MRSIFFIAGSPDGLSFFCLVRMVKLPAFVDLHVHFREPGQTWKETILTGSRAAARGGYTLVCAMPNLDPVPDSPEHLALEQAAIDNNAETTVEEANGLRHVIIKAKGKVPRGGYSSVDLTYRKSDGMLVKMILEEANGIVNTYEMMVR